VVGEPVVADQAAHLPCRWGLAVSFSRTHVTSRGGIRKMTLTTHLLRWFSGEFFSLSLANRKAWVKPPSL
jgi:hypothetical protein